MLKWPSREPSAVAGQRGIRWRRGLITRSSRWGYYGVTGRLNHPTMESPCFMMATSSHSSFPSISSPARSSVSSRPISSTVSDSIWRTPVLYSHFTCTPPTPAARTGSREPSHTAPYLAHRASQRKPWPLPLGQPYSLPRELSGCDRYRSRTSLNSRTGARSRTGKVSLQHLGVVGCVSAFDVLDYDVEVVGYPGQR